MTTSDKYIWAIRPLARLLEWYWPNHPEVIVGGFSVPDFMMPDRFSFYRIGEFADYPLERWSDGVIKFIRDVGDSVFLLLLEDMWPIAKVKGHIIQRAYDYMRQFEYVVKFDLTADRQFAEGTRHYGTLGLDEDGSDVNVLISDPNSQYHLSLMPGLWRRDLLLRAMKTGETPWQVELDGTPRLSKLRREMIVVGTDRRPYACTLAFRSGNPDNLLLDELVSEDVAALRKEGLIP